MTPLSRRALLRSAAIFAAAVLTACGFQLRGSANLPFKSIYLGFPENSTFGTELRRYITASGDTRVVKDPKQAEAILDVLAETRDKQVLALNSQGRVREYALIYRLNFRVRNNQQQVIQPPTQLEVSRDLRFNESQALATEAQEAVLYRDMQSDLVQQVLRRLAAIPPSAMQSAAPAAAPATAPAATTSTAPLAPASPASPASR